MKIQSYTCDECGVQKQESNHWVMAHINELSVTFMPWRQNLLESTVISHLCGEGCAARVQSRAIEGWHK